MDFGEKKEEFSPKQGKNIPVWQSPKYLESKAKAIEIITEGKFRLAESDFWILMNETKSGKMAYTGLIISHNGCLKLNDAMGKPFKAESVSIDKDGYQESLVYTYCNAEQGIYEVGEVSAKNCKIAYPYAMAYKRLFDRVVLKLSKLAYSGIYGEDEADEFAQRLDEITDRKEEKATRKTEAAPVKEKPFVCEHCSKEIKPYKGKTGKTISVKAHVEASKAKFGEILCIDCINSRNDQHENQ